MGRKGEKKWMRGGGWSEKTDGRSLVVKVSMKVRDCLIGAAFLEIHFGHSDVFLDP